MRRFPYVWKPRRPAKNVTMRRVSGGSRAWVGQGPITETSGIKQEDRWLRPRDGSRGEALALLLLVLVGDAWIDQQPRFGFVVAKTSGPAVARYLDANHGSPSTSTGTSDAVVVPSPSAPLRLFPQH